MQQGIDGGGGSGGLVRAYALLAANVFALTAAFGVLSRSAQIDTLTKSMEILSTTGGTYIKTLAMDMREAQRSYEANISAMETARAMLMRTIGTINR